MRVKQIPQTPTARLTLEVFDDVRMMMMRII
jgi:hypothetical protein